MHDTFNELAKIIAELQNVDASGITPESYLVRDLNLESIDMLETAVTINRRFAINVDDKALFLGNLRISHDHAIRNGLDPVAHIASKHPHLPRIRIEEILSDMANGPTVKVKDLVSYIEHYRQRTN